MKTSACVVCETPVTYAGKKPRRYCRACLADRLKEKQRAYFQRPEVKVKKRAYAQRPEAKEKRRAYAQRPERKIRALARDEARERGAPVAAILAEWRA